MTNRMNPYATHLAQIQPLIDVGRKIQSQGLDKRLLKLVDVRASQINGCGVCLDMHSKEAIAMGETAERLIMLDAWRETDLFTPREQAAFAWTETLTRLSESGAPDDVYELVKAHFSEEELVTLTLMIGVINTFNRIGVGFHVPPISQQRKAA